MSWAAPADENPFADPSVSAAKASGAGARYDDGAPSWLSGQGGAGQLPSNQPPPPPPPQGARSAGPPPIPGQDAPQVSAAELQRQANVPQMMVWMRVANMILCVFLSATAILTLVSIEDISSAVLACYLFAFSCILCCFETHLKVVAKTIAANFGFLYNAKGRAVFLIFVAVMCFSLKNVLALVAGILMMVNAVFNFWVIFRNPEFEKDLQRKDLESEGRDYLRANRGQLTQAGAEFARNNPDIARKGVEAAASTYV